MGTRPRACAVRLRSLIFFFPLRLLWVGGVEPLLALMNVESIILEGR